MFIIDDASGIVVTSVLVRINGASNEETKELVTANLASWAMNSASENTVGNQGAHHYLSRIAGYESRSVRIEQ